MSVDRIAVISVSYGHESPQDVSKDILHILLYHVKLNPTLCCTTLAPDQDDPGATPASCERGR
jgi:hypothetical protein